MLRTTTKITFHIVTAGAAVVAVTMAFVVGLTIIREPGRAGIWMILRASSIAAVFVVMAFMMISYLIRNVMPRKPP